MSYHFGDRPEVSAGHMQLGVLSQVIGLLMLRAIRVVVHDATAFTS